MLTICTLHYSAKIRTTKLFVSQFIGILAFLTSLVSSISCSYVSTEFISDWVSVYYDNNDDEQQRNDLKDRMGFGMFSRETTTIGSSQCYYYDDYDIQNIMDLPFRIATACNALATVSGLLILLYSFSAWCWTSTKFRKRSFAFISSCYYLCALGALGTQIIFMSRFCKWDRCNENNNNGDERSYCFVSRCRVGEGAACSITATVLWVTAGICTKLVSISSSARSDREVRLVSSRSYETTCTSDNS